MAMQIVIVDDHALVRAGIRSLLERLPAVEVIGEASNGEEAAGLAESLKPDIVLMDIAMPNVSGLEAASRVKAVLPQVKVIMLSMYATAEHVTEALRAGASGYLIKDCATSDLEAAIRAVSRGEIYLSPRISQIVVDGYVTRTAAGEAPPASRLTARQLEILRVIAQGKTTKEIAFQFELSVKTVEAHRAQIMERLGIHDIPGLVRYAMRAGLVPGV